MAGLVPAIHVFAALEQVVDARVKPGHDESQTTETDHREKVADAGHSAGVGLGGGLAGGGVVALALAAAALFSTMRTAMIEPS